MVKVVSHIPLTESQKKKIETAWMKRTKNNELSFEYSIDPKILGGFLVIDNDVFYDATIKSAILQIKQELKKI